jgi:site-specific DNA-methyltransferase (adenine-specific)
VSNGKEEMKAEVIQDCEIFNEDCMKVMAEYPDGYFNLAIVDPPYGGGNHSLRNFRSHGKRVCKYGKKIDDWDIAPNEEYFNELFRISQFQIIWGGNNFLLKPSNNFIIYNKLNIPYNFSLSQCEYAWTNLKGNPKRFDYFPKMENERFHPTQKPVALYKWLLAKYAESGWKMLDTHMGSGSSVIACIDMGYEMTACEIDAEYFEAAVKRRKEYAAQGVLALC